MCSVPDALSQERQHTKQHQHHHHHNQQRQQQQPLLMTSINVNSNNHTGNNGVGNNGGIGGHAWLSFPDVETELEKRSKNVGWSTWSSWSTCSRSCDGGIAQQLRRCHAPHGCRGEPVRYKICNMQVNCTMMQLHKVFFAVIVVIFGHFFLIRFFCSTPLGHMITSSPIEHGRISCTKRNKLCA